MVMILNEVFFEEEVRCDYTVSPDIKKIWAVELDLINKLKEVCDKYNLRYFAAGGTLIGAVRHQGFIPWDDDADFLMFREDFEKLKDVAPHEFNAPYALQTEANDPDIFLGGFYRLRNSETTNIEHYHLNHSANFGIWIDISVLDYLHENQEKRKTQVRKIRKYQRLLYAKTYGEYKSFLELSALHWKMYKFAASFISRNWIYEKLHRESTSCKSSRYVASFSYHSERFSPILFEKEDFSRSTLMDFEGLQIPVPISYDNILKLQYGDDYMSYPPIEQRIPKHPGIVNTEISYKKFLLNFDQIRNQLDNKTIVIFGAGQMLVHYLEHEGQKYPPDFVIDNSKGKWGTNVQNISVQPPESILNIPQDKLVIIICNIYYREISRQLKQMGVDQFYIYVQEKNWL